MALSIGFTDLWGLTMQRMIKSLSLVIRDDVILIVLSQNSGVLYSCDRHWFHSETRVFKFFVVTFCPCSTLRWIVATPNTQWGEIEMNKRWGVRNDSRRPSYSSGVSDVDSVVLLLQKKNRIKSYLRSFYLNVWNSI